jgi:hypothetical protein
MTAPKKLNIRITFTTKENKAEQGETGYIYYWHRIIGAAALLITTVTASIYYLYQTSDQPSPIAKSEAKLKEVNQSSIKGSSRKELMMAENNKEQVHAAVEKEITALPKEQKNNAPELFTQSEVKIFSKQIKRFVLAKTVRDKEPVGNINEINFDANNIATVYAYSHAVGLRDETLYYKWQLNGKKIAKVKVGVGSDRWRSYSRKYIQPQMHGNWSVTLENKQGEILAISRFQY